MRCAACGLPGHRYGRNEGADRYDPMACINSLRGELEKATEIRDHLRTLAEAVVTLAELDGHDQTAAKAKLVASDLADAVVVWEEV